MVDSFYCDLDNNGDMYRKKDKRATLKYKNLNVES